MNRSNFEQIAIDNEHKTLQYMTDKENTLRSKQTVHQQFINLSLLEIANGISMTIISIINELLDSSKPKELNDIIEIFFKDDRMIYVGLTIFLFTLGLYIIDISP